MITALSLHAEFSNAMDIHVHTSVLLLFLRPLSFLVLHTMMSVLSGGGNFFTMLSMRHDIHRNWMTPFKCLTPMTFQDHLCPREGTGVTQTQQSQLIVL